MSVSVVTADMKILRALMICGILLLLAASAWAVRSDCTIFASPAGSGRSCTLAAPCSFAQARANAVAGSRVCLMGGRYNVTTTMSLKSGTAAKPIVYESYGDSAATLFWNTTNNFNQMFSSAGARYYIIRELNFDGNYASKTFHICNHCDHITIEGNHVQHFVLNGIGFTGGSDYVTVTHNIVWHNGYNPHGYSLSAVQSPSGISLNQHGLMDSYAGLHNVVAFNVISGQHDPTPCHCDGNGITLDLSNQKGTGATLIYANVIFGNGSRAIVGNSASSTNYWGFKPGHSLRGSGPTVIANNTAYNNRLDTSLPSGQSNFREAGAQGTRWVNNISYSWPGVGTAPNFIETKSGRGFAAAGYTYHKSAWWNGTRSNFTPSDPDQFIGEDPQFTSAPSYSPTASEQHSNSIDGATMGNAFVPMRTSPVINAGINPTTLSGLHVYVISDMKKWVYEDILGTIRPQGSAFDLGAYEVLP